MDDRSDNGAAKVLVVEDSKFFANLLKNGIESRLGFETLMAPSYADAVRLVQQHRGGILAALVDLNLPDAPDGEVVDYILVERIPAIVFTATYTDETREYVQAKNIVDYVTKDNPANLDYLIELLGRLHRNGGVKVLLVDDSKVARMHTRELLERHRFLVVEAASATQAMKTLESDPAIRLVITDYHMPEVNGAQFVKQIRSKFRRDELAVIGLSAYGNDLLSARFMKNGASDFLNKPFLVEELFCRIYQNLDLVGHIRELKNGLALIDALRRKAERLNYVRVRADRPIADPVVLLNGYAAFLDRQLVDGGRSAVRPENARILDAARALEEALAAARPEAKNGAKAS
ncbi:MAG: response regulator [Rhodospirillales bacterium]|nr:response regulator [Rhodospirillales bacterium]